MKSKKLFIILGIIVIGIVFSIILSSLPPITPEGGPEAGTPKSEGPITEETPLSELGIIEITASKDGFSPSSFKIKARERIILKINYTEKETGHSFYFKDPELGIKGETGPGEDIGFPLVAPATAGEYEFYDEVADKSREKIIGKMLVEK